MHLSVHLPKIEPLHIEPPTRCPLRDRRNPKKKCNGTHFKAHQVNCDKPVRDTRYAQVTAQRYRCLKCQRTFRVYPTGVSPAHKSDTLKGLSVLLYVLGLSYQGVSDLLESLGCFVSKTTLYENVQAAGRHAIQLRQQWLKQQAGQVQVLSADFTHVKCKGANRIVAVATAVFTGQPITFDLLETEKALHIERWIRNLAKTLGAEVLVTDDPAPLGAGRFVQTGLREALPRVIAGQSVRGGIQSIEERVESLGAHRLLVFRRERVSQRITLPASRYRPPAIPVRAL